MKQEIFDENRSSATFWPCFTFNVTQRVRSSSSSVGGKMMVTGGYLPSQGTMSTTEVWTRRRGWRRGVPLSPGEGQVYIVITYISSERFLLSKYFY